MIKIENTTLRVRKIRQSRNGPFTVADLSTDIGEFRVKDQLLDAFDEGEYQATVWISEIYLKQYVAYGRGVTELRAQLHEVQIEAAAAHRAGPDRRDHPRAGGLQPDGAGRGAGERCSCRYLGPQGQAEGCRPSQIEGRCICRIGRARERTRRLVRRGSVVQDSGS